MVIRIANESDSHAIAVLHAESWRSTYRGMFSDSYLDGPIEEERLVCWQKRLATPSNNQFVLIAEDQKRLLGFVCIFLKADPVWGTLIDNLHVRVPVKRKGIGTQLLQEVAKWLLVQLPNDPVYLWALEKNYRARAFYENLQGKSVETRLEPQADGRKVYAVRYAWKTPTALLDAIVKKDHKRTFFFKSEESQLETALKFNKINESNISEKSTEQPEYMQIKSKL